MRQIGSTVKNFGAALSAALRCTAGAPRCTGLHQSLTQAHFGLKLPYKCLCVLSLGTQEAFTWARVGALRRYDLWRIVDQNNFGH